jgi:hypothetical protein|tara:strand:- start:819 stop:1010 length:192 start_codon:yes stop_codon:yes gene_type:complete
MIRDLKSRIQDNIKNYKKPTDLEELSAVQLKAFEILNKKAAPQKQLTLSEKKLNKAIAILLRK